MTRPTKDPLGAEALRVEPQPERPQWLRLTHSVRGWPIGTVHQIVEWDEDGDPRIKRGDCLPGEGDYVDYLIGPWWEPWEPADPSPDSENER